MKSGEIRRRFVDYFTKVLKEKNLGHVEVPSSSLVPENHPTLLFTNSGMVQFTPYFLGDKNPDTDFGSKRLCSVQKCIRTGDLDIIGKSKYHLVFFEMLGSWSIGDYSKKTAVELAFDLLTNKDYGYGLDPSKFIPTVFGGNEELPADEETIEAWKSVGIPDDRISRLPASENWWGPGGPTGPGPCGPCTEVLYDRGPEFGLEEEVPGMTDNPRYVEIWNAGVFIQFDREESGKLNELPVMSVDTGAGLERFAVLLQGVDSVFETDLFMPILAGLSRLGDRPAGESVLSARQKVAEHVKSASFMIAAGVFPSNKDQGYVLRRLLRSAFSDLKWKLYIDPAKFMDLVPEVINIYKDIYPEINQLEHIQEVMRKEYTAYSRTDEKAEKIIRKTPGKIDAFNIYQTTGASGPSISQIALKYEKDVDFSNFEKRFSEHQDLSRKGAEQKFKGGVLGDDPQQRKLHTATHLLHKALREILGEHVQQMGSNITPERLRFDFSHPEKLTGEQIKKVENLVNEKIKEGLPVNQITLPKEEAEKSGALHFFKEKYGDKVSVYFTGDNLENAWSKEFCGGPHVPNTSEIGGFKILKEESVGKGVRRVKAVLFG